MKLIDQKKDVKITLQTLKQRTLNSMCYPIFPLKIFLKEKKRLNL